jgi:transcriptional regulator with XRE-family HTH domain
VEDVVLTGAQVRAARALLRWEVAELAAAAGIPEAEVALLEAHDGAPAPGAVDADAIRRALEAAGVDLLDGGAPGARLRPQAEGMRPDELNAENDG